MHSNPDKFKDGLGQHQHLNAIGLWIRDNVSRENGRMKGLWCTNCHNNISKELYKRDALEPGQAFAPGPNQTIRGNSLDEIARALNMSPTQLKAAIDPKVCLDGQGRDIGPGADAWASAKAGRQTAAIGVVATDGRAPIVSKDIDGDISVKLIDPNPNHAGQHTAEKGVAAPYEAATQGRDYWLSPGVPHCADCHEAPFVEGQGGAAYPINQPGKYSSMRYSKGHAGLACQACHESIHGLMRRIPRGPDNLPSGRQLNPDGSHGPLKCGTCHKDVNGNGVPAIAAKICYGAGTSRKTMTSPCSGCTLVPRISAERCRESRAPPEADVEKSVGYEFSKAGPSCPVRGGRAGSSGNCIHLLTSAARSSAAPSFRPRAGLRCRTLRW